MSAYDHPRAQEHLEDEIRRLRAAGHAFAVATVVRTVDATSAKPGAKALVLGDGTLIKGWIGGGCARAAVSKAAMQALAEGRPQFVSLRPEDLLAAEGLAPGDERDGIRFRPQRLSQPTAPWISLWNRNCPNPGCSSSAAGPWHLPWWILPHASICIARSVVPVLVQIEVDAVQEGFALDTGSTARRFVVVATQGKGDEAALRAALASGAGYVAFVGSRRKFATLAERLRRDGIDMAALDAVKAPAGLDIHAITPDEIALSILAQIVAHRRAGGAGRR